MLSSKDSCTGTRCKHDALFVLGFVPAAFLSVLGSIGIVFGPDWSSLPFAAGIAGTIGFAMALFGYDPRLRYWVACLLVLGQLGMATLLVPFLQSVRDLESWMAVLAAWFTCGPAVSGLVLLHDVIKSKRGATQ